MEAIIAAIGIALTAVVFALLFQKQAPGIAFVLTLTASIMIMVTALQQAGQIIDTLRQMLGVAGLDSSIYIPVIKAVGIACIIRLASAMCKDAGQSSIAAKLEILGAVAAVAVILPLFERVLDLVSSMLL